MSNHPAPAAALVGGVLARRVLVVKDRTVGRRRYHHELRAQGFDVTDVFHGRDALSAVLAGGHDLFVFEVRCNSHGGEDATLLRVLRTYLHRPDVPVILASFFPERWTPERREGMGVSAVLHQPVSSPAEMVQAARRALGIADPTERPRAPYPFPPPSARRVA